MPSPSVRDVRTRLLSRIVAAALALTACGGGETGGGGSATGGGGAVPEGELLSFEAETIEGETVDVADFVGSDLVIWFWAPW